MLESPTKWTLGPDVELSGGTITVTRSFRVGEDGIGFMTGAELGAAFAAIPAGGLAIGGATDLYLQVNYAWQWFGFGLRGDYNIYRGDLGTARYSWTGWGVTPFVQVGIVPGILFADLGFGRAFGWTTKNDDSPSARVVIDNSTSADAWRGLGRLTVIFINGAKSQWGFAIEAQHLQTDSAILNGQDVTWRSEALLAQVTSVWF